MYETEPVKKSYRRLYWSPGIIYNTPMEYYVVQYMTTKKLYSYQR